ncbi:MAG: hypothetical protein PHI31_06170 [Desulfuromonadaceae bacterium]|nr:hypothetical protein [Desulfuromonadaceae bacterium]
MKRLVFGLLLVAGTLLGCAQNYFNIPADNFVEKVKVLGVAPIFIDADSDIIYPQKDLLVPLISDLNRKYEPLLVSKLQKTGTFFTVTPMADEPRQLFTSLMSRRERRNDADVEYNKYFWKNDAISSYIQKNRIDAVMVVVVSGLTKKAKLFSSNLLTSLETNYNFLTMTAQIIGEDGTVLWEYPNFRSRLLAYPPLVNLQYPDFSESEANVSRKTEVRFKSLDGIRRTLEQKKSNWLLQESSEPDVYGKLFDDMTSVIIYTGERQTKGAGTAVAAEVKAVVPAEKYQKPAEAIAKPAQPVPATVTPVQAPAQIQTQKNIVEVPVSPSSGSNDIVPATESTK